MWWRCPHPTTRLATPHCWPPTWLSSCCACCPESPGAPARSAGHGLSAAPVTVVTAVVSVGTEHASRLGWGHGDRYAPWPGTTCRHWFFGNPPGAASSAVAAGTWGLQAFLKRRHRCGHADWPAFF